MLYSLYEDGLISIEVAVAKSGKSKDEFLEGLRESHENPLDGDVEDADLL